MSTRALLRSIDELLDADVALEWRRHAGAEVGHVVRRIERARRRLQHELAQALPSDASLVQAAEAYLNAQRSAAASEGSDSSMHRARRALVERLAHRSEATARSPRDEEATPSTHRILLAVDGSPPAEWATHVAGGLARSLDARVMVITVLDPTEREPIHGMEDVRENRRRAAASLLDRAVQALPASAEGDQMLREGVPSAEIVAAARTWQADLIVMGSRGRGRFASFVLGSTAEAVVRDAPCPVLTIARQPQEFAGEHKRLSVEAALR